MRMIKFAPRVLAASLSLVAFAGASSTAGAVDCRKPDGAIGLEPCVVSHAPRAVAGLAMDAGVSATIPDDPASLEGLLPLDLADMGLADGDLADGMKAWGALPGLYVALPPSSTTPFKPATGPGMLGTWSKLEMERIGDDARTRSGAGLKFTPSRSATVGMSLESEESVVAASLTEQTKMAATFDLKPSPLIIFEAKVAWAQHSVGALASRDTQSAQSELSARLNGDWRLGAFKLAPNVTVVHASDAGVADVAGTMIGTVVVAPTISRPVTLDHARALEPFLTFKQELEINAPALRSGSTILTNPPDQRVAASSWKNAIPIVSASRPMSRTWTPSAIPCEASFA